MDVKTLCLGALACKPATGYDIRKNFFEEGPFSHFQDAAFGSIYPALKRLVAEGLVVGVDEQQESRPDKRVYHITPAGRQALYEALKRPPAPDKVRSDTMFVLYFCQVLPPEHVQALLDGRMAWLKKNLDAMREHVGKPMEAGQAFALGLGLAVYGAAYEYMRAHGHELVAAAGSPQVQTPQVAE